MCCKLYVLCFMLHIACCTLCVACSVSHAACCMCIACYAHTFPRVHVVCCVTCCMCVLCSVCTLQCVCVCVSCLLWYMACTVLHSALHTCHLHAARPAARWMCMSCMLCCTQLHTHVACPACFCTLHVHCTLGMHTALHAMPGVTHPHVPAGNGPWEGAGGPHSGLAGDADRGGAAGDSGHGPISPRRRLLPEWGKCGGCHVGGGCAGRLR